MQLYFEISLPSIEFHAYILYYSAALLGKATNKWTEGNLDKWLKSPADWAPGKQHSKTIIINMIMDDGIHFILPFYFTSKL